MESPVGYSTELVDGGPLAAEAEVISEIPPFGPTPITTPAIPISSRVGSSIITDMHYIMVEVPEGVDL